MHPKKDIFKPIRIYKFCEMSAMLILALIYFLIVYLNDDLRNHVFSDPAITVLSIIVWLCLMIGFICSTIDFIKLKAIAQTERNLNQLAYLDHLSGIPNRHSLDLLFCEFDGRQRMNHIGGILFKIDNLYDLNTAHGRESGDKCIKDFSTMLQSGATEDVGFFCRNSGNEFIVIFENYDELALGRFLSTIREKLHTYNREQDGLPMKIGYVTMSNEVDPVSRLYAFITRLYDKYKLSAEEL